MENLKVKGYSSRIDALNFGEDFSDPRYSFSKFN